MFYGMICIDLFFIFFFKKRARASSAFLTDYVHIYVVEKKGTYLH